ncbi:hypothetical protein KCP76_05300 [Salmonella enterica subsp. enterica serovar Weltevreden]|nr:hypothetical protein KCP76_05300 [Salmonella enterica subsp. enterica serovar Weltevreden]
MQGAQAEQLYLSMCHEVQKQLDPQTVRIVRLSTANCRADGGQMYVSFSLFQSMPDAWESISFSRYCRWKG